MNNHTFNRTYLMTILVTISAIVIMNILVDPFDLLGTSSLRQGYSTNERYNKFKHLLEHPNTYNAYIFGTSRMGHYDPDYLNKRTEHLKWYNASYLAAVHEEMYQTLEALYQSNTNIDHILLGLDPFHFLTPRNNPSAYRWLHPTVSGEAWYQLKLKALLYPSPFQWVSKLWHHHLPNPEIFHDYETGVYHYPKAWLANFESTTQNLPDYHQQIHPEAKYHFVRLATYIKQQQYPATVFLHPLSQEQKTKVTQKLLDDIRDLVYLHFPDAVDLTHHSIGQNDEHYYDYRHYRPEVASMIIDMLFPNKVTQHAQR